MIFLHGFRSDRQGGKAQAVEELCVQAGHGCLRFDAFGHGQSGGDYRDGTIGLWARDAVEILDRLTEGPQILVGSSFGGWIATLMALARPDRVRALVGLAPAPDFTEDLMWHCFSQSQRDQMRDQGYVVLPDCESHPGAPDQGWHIPARLIDEARAHLVLDKSLPIHCPVRLIHGQQDDDVPWDFSNRLAQAIEGSDIQICLIKDGGHRLSREGDLARIRQVIAELF